MMGGCGTVMTYDVGFMSHLVSLCLSAFVM